MILKHHYLVFFKLLFFIGLTAHGQLCDIPTDKDYQKKYEKISSEKTETESRKSLLEDLLLAYPDNPQVLFALAKISFEEIRVSELNGDYQQAQKLFKQLLEVCPDYNVSAYYYLGIIAYSKLKYTEAIKYFEEFVSFPKNEKDPEHAQRLADAVNAIPIIQQEALNSKSQDILASDVKKPFVLLNVSSPKDEYLPMLSPDNSLLYFTRKFLKQGKDDLIAREIEEFTEATRLNEAELVYDKGTVMKPPFNLGDNYGGVSLTANNKEMYITVCQPDSDGYKNCDIYHTYYKAVVDAKGVKKMVWAPLLNLGPAINLTDGWESQPSISPDGKTLYFSRYGFNTRQTDIYFSERDTLGNWLEAKPIKGYVNGSSHDKAPFLHQDGKTLYFSSDAQGGYGGFDIYYSKKMANGTWDKPVNLGLPINTTGDEHGLIVSTDGKYAVYASNSFKNSSEFELIACELKRNLQPEEVIFVKGKLDKLNSGSKVEVKNEQGRLLQTALLDTIEGDYAAIINKSEVKGDLILAASNNDGAFDTRVINTSNTASTVLQAPSMSLLPVVTGKVYTLNDIVFDFDSSVLTERSKTILNEFLHFLLEKRNYQVHIQGHTDSVGNAERNLVLSKERALAVKEYLVAKGVDNKRFTYEGFGSSQPISDNNSEEGRAKNRRTEFILKIK